MDTTHDDPSSANDDLSRIFAEHRERLRRMVQLRMDRRLLGRVDASDVIQETYLEATQRYDAYCSDPQVSPLIWLRFLTGQKLIQMQRTHLGTQARDVNREVSIYNGAMPEARSAALAAQLIGKQTSPTQAVVRAELKIRVQEALNNMDEIDREILSLRHFEQLSNAEVSELLRISKDTAYRRYIRAVRRLKVIMGPPSASS